MSDERLAPALLCVHSQHKPTLPDEDALPEDVEELVRATKLCDTCCPMFGCSRSPHPSQSPYVLESLDPLGSRGHYDYYGKYRKHHASHGILRQSAEAGCLICAMLYERWKLYAASSGRFFFTHRSQCSGGVSFYFRKGLDAVDIGVGMSEGVMEDHEETAHDSMDFSLRGVDQLLLLGMAKYSAMRKHILVQPKLHPNQALATAAGWVKACLSDGHRECRDARRGSGRPYLKPTRLLYLDHERTDSLRLISVAEENDYQYVTLSHRWGFPEPPKLSKHDTSDQPGKLSIRALTAGIEISGLPRTFREAIDIVRHCGLKHIWIDCLCIVQDKDYKGRNPDWEMEAGKMADIYAGGLFNIAATHARNSDAGLFTARRDVRLPVVRDLERRGRTRQAKVLWEDPTESFEREVVSSELLSRGWVYQEVLLTPSNLFCTADEMWWSCLHATCSQTFPGGVIVRIAKHVGYDSDNEIDEDHEDDEPMFIEDSLRSKKGMITSKDPIFPQEQHRIAWEGVLESYTGTAVTFGDDRLAAISGVSNLFRTLFPDQLLNTGYHSGVWCLNFTDGLYQQLLWAGDRNFPLPSHRHSATLPIPSWSPVSFAGKITNHSRGMNSSLLPLEFVSLDSSQLDMFGRARNQAQCILHLRGVLVTVDTARLYDEDEFEKWSKNYRVRNEWQRSSLSRQGDLPMPIKWDSEEERRLAGTSNHNGYAVLGFNMDLSVPYFIGLLLRPLESPISSNGGKGWVRCGLIDFCDSGKNIWLRVFGEAYQLNRHGFTWMPDRVQHYERANSGYWRYLWTPPDLEDIYIL